MYLSNFALLSIDVHKLTNSYPQPEATEPRLKNNRGWNLSLRPLNVIELSLEFRQV